MHRRFTLKFIVAAALTSVVGFAGPALGQEFPAKIRLGDVGFGFGQPFGRGLVAIADAKGFIADEFKDTPVKLEFTYFVNTGPAINEAIANQQLEFASYGAVPNTIGKANGLPTRILLSYGGTTIFGGARADLPINSVKDLKGRKIAVQKATIIHWSLITTLRQNGLTERDVTLVDLKNADQLAAINAKSVDAIFGGSFFLPLRDQGVLKLISNSGTAGGKATGLGAFVVTDEFQKQYPEATLRVTRGLLRAAHWLGQEANREEAFGIWARTGVTLPILREEFDGVSLKNAFNPVPDDFFTAQYRGVIAFNKEQKLIRNDVDLGQWLEPKYVEAGLKSLDLQSFWPRRNADGAAAGASN
ncbi:MAG: Sulfonate transport system substrate-binding protein [Xanthobacteraceae bacterium]|nr:Sulfonate transport system substrate-binding protein [Xanthobacteraceae bacterium]